MRQLFAFLCRYRGSTCHPLHIGTEPRGDRHKDFILQQRVIFGFVGRVVEQHGSVIEMVARGEVISKSQYHKLFVMLIFIPRQNLHNARGGCVQKQVSRYQGVAARFVVTTRQPHDIGEGKVKFVSHTKKFSGLNKCARTAFVRWNKKSVSLSLNPSKIRHRQTPHKK